MKVYKSKVDLFYYMLAIIIALTIIVSAMFLFQDLESAAELVILVLAYISVLAAYFFAIVHQFLSTKYVLKDNAMFIESGFYKKRIPIQDILEINRKSSFGKEPALSRKRLYINYTISNGTTAIGISPKNEEGFLNQLAGNANFKGSVTA